MNDQLNGWIDGGRHASFEQNTSSTPVLKRKREIFSLAKEPEERTGPTYLPTQEMVTCMSLVGGLNSS